MGIRLDKDALRVLRYRLMSRIRLEAFHRGYILGLAGDDEDDPDSTDCYFGMLTGRAWRWAGLLWLRSVSRIVELVLS